MIPGWTDQTYRYTHDTWHIDTCHLVINQHVCNNKLVSNLSPLKSQVSILFNTKISILLYMRNECLCLWTMWTRIHSQDKFRKTSKNHKNETFTYDRCEFTANTKRSLNEHQDRVHSSILYRCDQCVKSFTCK